jgi:hypothetical protein
MAAPRTCRSPALPAGTPMANRLATRPTTPAPWRAGGLLASGHGSERGVPRNSRFRRSRKPKGTLSRNPSYSLSQAG